MRNDTEEFIEMLNEMLNEMYHSNYTVLRSLARSQNSRPSDFSSGWFNDKHQALAKDRSDFFESITSSYTKCFSDDAEGYLKDEQDKVMRAYRVHYHEDKQFDECFEGFDIIDADFADKFFQYNILNISVDNSLSFKHLCETYLDYLEYYRTHCSFVAFASIMETLNDELSKSGYKTFYFEKPLNEKVSFISAEEISTMEKLAKEIKRKVDKNKNHFSKKRAKLYKKIQNPKVADKFKNEFRTANYYDIHYDNYSFFADELCYMIKVLKTRLLSANTPSKDYKELSVIENFNDLLFGVNIFDKNNNYHTDKIYIHELERDHLDYVARQLEFLSKLQLVSITEANQNTPDDAPQPQ